MEVTPQEEKSPHITDRVEEPMPADMQTDQSELDIEDLTSTVGLEISPMSTTNPEVQTPSNEEPVVDIPNINSQINFVFRDQQWKSGDQEWLVKPFDLMVRIPQVTSIMVHVYLQQHFNRQIKGCVMFNIFKICVQA